MWRLIANKIQVRASIGNFCSDLWVGLTIVSRRKIKFSSFSKKICFAQSLCISISLPDAMRISAPNNLKCGVNTRFRTQLHANTELQQVSKNTALSHFIL
jgi:hypothetical protein